MSFPLDFAQRYSYDSREPGITLDTILRYGNEEFQCKAKVDTGAHYCLFAREIGEVLGINIESGIKRDLGTLRGPLTAFGHELTLGTLGFFFDTTVYFAKDEGLPRNLLGRHGWLMLLRLAIIDYDAELYLSRYDDQV